MPLKHDKSDASRSYNIHELIRSGHPVKNAVAAGYAIQRGEAYGGYVPGYAEGGPAAPAPAPAPAPPKPVKLKDIYDMYRSQGEVEPKHMAPGGTPGETQVTIGKTQIEPQTHVSIGHVADPVPTKLTVPGLTIPVPAHAPAGPQGHHLPHLGKHAEERRIIEQTGVDAAPSEFRPQPDFMKALGQHSQTEMTPQHLAPSGAYEHSPEVALAHGGAVPHDEASLHAHLVGCLKYALGGHVQKFAVGGSPTPPALPERPGVPSDAPGIAEGESVTAGPPPRAAYPAGPVPMGEVTSEEPPPAGAGAGHSHAAPVAHHWHSLDLKGPEKTAERPAEFAATAAPGHTEPSPLDAIEAERRRRVQAAENPGIGRTIGRALANGLSAFGHGQTTDFAAGDAARVKAANEEAGHQSANYLTRPSAEAGRAGAIAESPQSKRLQLLIKSQLGVDANGMSSDELKDVVPILVKAQDAKLAGNKVEFDRLMGTAKLEIERVKTDLAAKHLDIDQQNANTRANAAGKDTEKFAYAKSKDLAQALNGVRGSKAFQNAEEALRRVSNAEGLLDKPNLSPAEVEFAASELGNIAIGGHPPDEVLKILSAPTLEGKIAQAKQFLTGSPGNAGYNEIVQKVFKPYLASLKRAQQDELVRHTASAFATHPGASPELEAQFKADPMFLVKAGQAAVDQSHEAAGGEPASGDADSALGFQPE